MPGCQLPAAAGQGARCGLRAEYLVIHGFTPSTVGLLNIRAVHRYALILHSARITKNRVQLPARPHPLRGSCYAHRYQNKFVMHQAQLGQVLLVAVSAAFAYSTIWLLVTVRGARICIHIKHSYWVQPCL